MNIVVLTELQDVLKQKGRIMKKVFFVSLILFSAGAYGITQYSIFEDPVLKVICAIIFLISSALLGFAGARIAGAVLEERTAIDVTQPESSYIYLKQNPDPKGYASLR